MVALNTNRSVKPSEGRAVVGGCLRDDNAKLIDTFAANLDKCSTTR
ncbi:hypothetical protein LINPERHAP1_LOCUS17314 [Linum perenne]